MDLIDSLVARLKHIEPTITETRAKRIERQLRIEFGGAVTRARKKPTKKELEQAVRERWDGRSVARIAQEVGIHRATAYRVIGSILKKRTDTQ